MEEPNCQALHSTSGRNAHVVEPKKLKPVAPRALIRLTTGPRLPNSCFQTRATATEPPINEGI